MQVSIIRHSKMIMVIQDDRTNQHVRVKMANNSELKDVLKAKSLVQSNMKQAKKHDRGKTE